MQAQGSVAKEERDEFATLEKRNLHLVRQVESLRAAINQHDERNQKLQASLTEESRRFQELQQSRHAEKEKRQMLEAALATYQLIPIIKHAPVGTGASTSAQD